MTQPSRPPQQHPFVEGNEMHKQLPVQTPFTGSASHLLQHAVPIFHQLMALKKALGNAKTGEKNNPGGVSNAF